MAAADYTSLVQQIYISYFGRPADTLGLANYAAKLDALHAPTTLVGLLGAASTNASIATLVNGFGTSAESTALYGTDTIAFVNAIYTNVLNRAADFDGLLYWAGQINTGAVTKAQAALAIADGALHNTSAQGVIDAAVLANKTTVATNFTAAIDTGNELLAYSGDAAAAAARDLLKTVTSTTVPADFQANVTATLNTLVDVVTHVPGLNFTLTSAADTTLTGGSGNDVYVATIGTDAAAANGTTLNAGDVLNGGIGTDDTLSISVSGTDTGATNTTAVTLKNIEDISVSNYQTNDAFNTNIDLAQATGVSKISLISSAASGDTFFTTVGGIVTAEMGNGAGDLGITYTSAAVAGTADAQTLNLTGQTAGTFTVGAAAGGIETLNISSKTASSSILIGDTNATITKIVVTGDKNLTLAEGAAPDSGLTTVDASAFTGKLKITTGSVAHDMNVTGGAGNDTLIINNFTSADTVNGGAGSDTLRVDAAAITATTLAHVTNVETLGVTAAGTVTLAANVVPTTIDADTGAATIQTITFSSGYTNATTVYADAGDVIVNTGANIALTAEFLSSTAVTVTGGTGTDTVNIDADSTTVTFAGAITGVEKVVVVDSGDDAPTGDTPAGKDVALTLGNYATSLTIDGSQLDAGTILASGAVDVDDETLTVDGSAVATATVVLNITGGAGQDSLTGGAGNDIINGGAGNDSINGASAGDDSISGGAGDDTINMGAALTSADTIDGGAGSDTLIVTNLSATALAHVTNIETLSFTGTGSIAANLSFNTIDLTNGVSTLTFATGYTNATTVYVDGDTVVNTAGVALTVAGKGADINASTITGGTGTDTLNITADTTTVAFTNLTSIDKVVVADNGDAASGSHIAGKDLTLTLTGYGTALSIDASALDAGTVDNTGAMNADYENLTIVGASSKSLTVTGGAGADTIVGSTVSTDSLSGGAGNDTFTMGANLKYTDTIDGGAGTDTITVSSASDIDFMKATNLEKMTLNGGAAALTTLSSYFDATGITSIKLDTVAAKVDASGTQVGHTFSAQAAVNETVLGGLGNDTFKFTDTATLDANDSINGGAGTDTISISNAVASAAATIDFNKVTKVETIALGTASGADATTAETLSLTINAGITSTTAQTIAIDASVVTDTHDTVTIVNNNDQAKAAFSITGGAGADTLAGGAGNDTVSGGSGADLITGGSGADVLTGGAGADTFVYNANSAGTIIESASTASDTISDFTTTSDLIQVNLAVTSGTVNATYVGSAATNGDALSLLSSKVGEYFYNTTTHQFVMDVDGNGLIQANDLFVTLTGTTALSASDVSILLTGVLAGTANADTFDITAVADDNVTGLAGNDTFNATQATLDANDTIIGGAGTADTLNIAGTGTTTLSSDVNLATVENINLTGTAAQTLNLTGQTEAFNVAMSNAGDSVTVNATVADTLTGGTGNDTFTINTVDGHAFLPQATVAGGAGSADKIVLGLATTTLVDADFAHVTGVEKLTLTGVSTIVLGANATTDGLSTVTTGTGNTTVTSTETIGLTVDATLVAGTLTTGAASANYTITAGVATDVTATGSSGTLNITWGNDAGNAAALATGSGNVTVTGGDVADIITVTGMATAAQSFIGTAAKFSVTATTNAQTITTGALNDTVNAGAGADTIDVGSGTDTIAQKAAAGAGGGDSGTFAVPGTNTISTTTFDVITGMALGDKIQLTATAYTGAAGAAAGLVANGTAGNDLSTITPADNAVEIVRGTYNAVAHTFVGDVAGTSSLVIYDADATLTTTAYEAIVLVGYVQASVVGIGGGTGLITLG